MVRGFQEKAMASDLLVVVRSSIEREVEGILASYFCKVRNWTECLFVCVSSKEHTEIVAPV